MSTEEIKSNEISGFSLYDEREKCLQKIKQFYKDNNLTRYSIYMSNDKPEELNKLLNDLDCIVEAINRESKVVALQYMQHKDNIEKMLDTIKEN